MQRGIPPVEATIEAERGAEEDRAEHEQRGHELELRRDVDVEPVQQPGQQSEGDHQESEHCVGPVLQEDEADHACHETSLDDGREGAVHALPDGVDLDGHGSA